MYNVTDEVPENTRTAIHSCDGEINLNDLIARKPISCLWCLIPLRFDIAFQEQEAGKTPNINRYGRWIKCEARWQFYRLRIIRCSLVLCLSRWKLHSVIQCSFPERYWFRSFRAKKCVRVQRKRRGLKGWKTKVTALSAWVASPF